MKIRVKFLCNTLLITDSLSHERGNILLRWRIVPAKTISNLLLICYIFTFFLNS